MRDELHKTCANHGHALYASYRSNRIDWLLELARKGSGALILPESSIPNDPHLIALPIKDVELKRDIKALRYRQQPSRAETDGLIKEFM